MQPNLSILVLKMALAGCGSVVPSTVARLAGLSPLEADPAGFEVGLVLPEGVGVMPDTAVLELEARQSETGETLAEDIVLERIEGDVPLWRVAEADLAAIRAFQEQARAWEDADPEASSGAISVGIGPCIRGAGPAPNAVISVLLRTSQDAPLLPLVRNAPLSGFSDAGDIAALPACP